MQKVEAPAGGRPPDLEAGGRPQATERVGCEEGLTHWTTVKLRLSVYEKTPLSK